MTRLTRCSALVIGLTSVLAAAACSGSTTRPPAEEPTSEAAEPDSEPAETALADDAGEDASEATSGDVADVESDPSDTATGAPAAKDSDTKGRELKYTMTPEGLSIEVAGVSFLATATPIKVGGGWGVRVKTTAKSKDGKEHQLLSPRRGPLAFAGSVQRGGQSSRFGDKREGDQTEPVTSTVRELTRDWPGDSGEKPLKAGDTLALEVGLWGLGTTREDGRPVRDFFLVKMTAGKAKPSPVVQPPARFQSEE